MKLDGAANPPSRVVHIRSLPHEVAETDVVQLGMPFGKMTNVLVLKQKNQVREMKGGRFRGRERERERERERGGGG